MQFLLGCYHTKLVFVVIDHIRAIQIRSAARKISFTHPQLKAWDAISLMLITTRLISVNGI